MRPASTYSATASIHLPVIVHYLLQRTILFSIGLVDNLSVKRCREVVQDRCHRLAGTVSQQSVDVLTQRRMLRAMTEAVLELIQPPRQTSRDRRL